MSKCCRPRFNARALFNFACNLSANSADAFRLGNFGVMDYCNMKNVISDTDMRSSIAGITLEQGTRTITRHQLMVVAMAIVLKLGVELS